MKLLIKVLGVAVTIAVVALIAYDLGQKQEPKSIWLSQLLANKSGSEGYAVDLNVMCPKTRGLVPGKVQIDYNRATGKWRTIRDDARNDSSCFVVQIQPSISGSARPQAPAPTN